LFGAIRITPAGDTALQLFTGNASIEDTVAYLRQRQADAARAIRDDFAVVANQQLEPSAFSDHSPRWIQDDHGEDCPRSDGLTELSDTYFRFRAGLPVTSNSCSIYEYIISSSAMIDLYRRPDSFWCPLTLGCGHKMSKAPIGERKKRAMVSARPLSEGPSSRQERFSGL